MHGAHSILGGSRVFTMWLGVERLSQEGCVHGKRNGSILLAEGGPGRLHGDGWVSRWEEFLGSSICSFPSIALLNCLHISPELVTLVSIFPWRCETILSAFTALYCNHFLSCLSYSLDWALQSLETWLNCFYIYIAQDLAWSRQTADVNRHHPLHPKPPKSVTKPHWL